jgi:hypothetical protein
MKSKLTAPSLLALTIVVSAIAQIATAQSKTNPITTAVPFLSVSADARTGSMGDISAATSPDVNSIFYNGSKTVFNEPAYGIGVSYTPWLRELDLNNIYLLSLASFYKLNDKETVSLGVRYFSQGSFAFTDNIGNQVSTFKPNDIAIEAGYSRKLSAKLGVGLSLRYIHSKLADNSTDPNYKSGSAVSADLSAFYTMKNGWNFGVAITNLGSKINYGGSADTKSYIPANLSIGTAYTKTINTDNKISFGLDINKLLVPTPPDPSDAAAVAKYNDKSVVGSWFSSFGDAPGGFKEELKEFQIGLGGEYSYRDMFSLRAGYYSENKTKGDRNYFTVGAGVKYKMTGLNFSYLVPTGDNSTTASALKNTIRLSLLFDFKK